MTASFKPSFCKNSDQGWTFDVCCFCFFALGCWLSWFVYSSPLPFDDNLPEISQYVLFVLLYAVTDVAVRLVSQVPYSKGKEKAKALSASPAAASYVRSIYLVL